MEPIKITDKLTLRQEALRMAIQIHENVLKGSTDIYGTANKCASYIRMNADLPEYVDPNKDFKEMMEKLQDNFKPNPWISVDSEIKPAKGVEVLCALHYGINNIEYVVMSYDPERNMWYGGNDDDNENHIVAWCKIPPFAQPTL